MTKLCNGLEIAIPNGGSNSSRQKARKSPHSPAAGGTLKYPPTQCRSVSSHVHVCVSEVVPEHALGDLAMDLEQYKLT